MRHLRSGHSHEDIDQIFGSLSLYIVKHGKTLQSPKDFCALIERFCATADRPYENERSVVLLDQHRPWILGRFSRHETKTKIRLGEEM